MANISIPTTSEIRELVRSEIDEALTRHRQERKKVTEYLTRKQTADLLQVSLVTLHDWTKRGVLKAYRIGSRDRYRRDEVERIVEGKSLDDEA